MMMGPAKNKGRATIRSPSGQQRVRGWAARGRGSAPVAERPASPKEHNPSAGRGRCNSAPGGPTLRLTRMMLAMLPSRGLKKLVMVMSVAVGV
jgi:hypothetical protein